MIGLMIALLVFPMASADVVIPTKTKVYFEQNGQPYEGKIDFTVKGYGYATGMPGDPNFNPNREPGTYTPEVVLSFSATYTNYGSEIYENYYRNYVHIDYYELEGKTEDDKTFIIKNIESIPTSCIDINPEENEEYQSCIADLKKPNFIDPSTQPAGTTREDYMGRIWTKGSDGWWTTQDKGIVQYTTCQENNLTKPSPDAVISSSEKHKTYTSFDDSDDYKVGAKRTDSEGNVWTKEDNLNWYREVTTTCFTVNKTESVNTQWGDVMWYEVDKEMYAHNEAKKKCEEILDNIYNSEDYYEQQCELRFNLDNADWNFTPPEPKGFWSKIKCFFSRLFGGSC